MTLGSDSYSTRISYLRFDLTELQGTTIDSAELQLFVIATTSPHIVGVHSCSRAPWDEFTITYNNKPNYDEKPLATVSVSSNQSWYDWIVTNETSKSLAKGFLSVILVSEDAHGDVWSDQSEYVCFCALDYEEFVQFCPKLDVEYTNTTTLPTTNASTSFNPIVFPLVLFCLVTTLRGDKKKRDM